MSQSECRCKGHVTLVASVLVLLAAAGVASGEFRIPRSLPAGGGSTAAINHTANPDGICPSMDIRNHVSALRELENCTVIEGFLQIVLIGQSNGSSEWQNYSFPNLREITDYLLLFRVFGLSSLRDLFPNLTLIRGQTLAYSHSLIIYEALQLREIGLASLTDIQRGSVMISKNPNLCYVDTVDWDRIAKGGKGYNYFKENADPKDCTPCPTHCPKGVDGRPLCWTNQDCQKVCQNCGKSSCTLTSGGVEACCDEVCLGGCRAPANASECHVCHNVTQNGSCRSKCIPGTYMFMQRRCVSDAECIRMPIPREVPQHERETFRWKPFNGECLKDCPTDHVETKEVGIDSKPYYTCKPCLGSCPKSCLGMMVINIERAQNLKGCTRIDGDLVIQVKGGDNIVKELEDNLGAIEEISGFLKIVRSYPLLSLNFLRNLRVIGGKNLESKRNALVVMENENLQELWNWETRSHKLRISNGSVLFHFNPKLCLDKIHDFLNVSMPNQTFSDLEVSPSSNGDKVACNLQELDLHLVRVESEVVTLSWEKFRANDYRSLIRYIISLKEAPQQTVTYYDGRDACGGDGWRTIDVTPNTDDDPLQTDFIPNLKPFTQYAVYVRTLTVAGERPADRVGGRSRIVYFRTKATRPSSPENIIAYANSSTQLVIEWQPPRHPNGIVTFYIITGDFEEENKDYIDKVDYCQDHFLSFSGRGSVKPSTEATSLKETSVSPVVPYKPRSPSDSVTVSKSSEEECCVCGTGDKKSLQVNEEEHAFGTAFEDYLHNIIYVQGDYYGDDGGQSELRRKRSFDAHFMENEVAAPGDKGFSDFHPLLPFDSDVAYVVVDVEDAYEDHYLRKFQRKVNETRITIKSLQPFSEYAISVRACHEPDPETNLTLCSKKAAVTTARTQPSEDGDRIPSEYLNVTSLNDTRSVMIHWHDPQQPNGIILRYDLKYQRVDLDGTRNPEPITKCIRRKEFSTSKRVYILRDLAPGNYSFTLRAVSRAGPGPFTNPVYHRITEVSSGLDGTVLAVILSVVLVFVVLSAAGMVYYLRTKMNHSNVIVSLNPDYISTVYREDEWEVDRGNVELLRELGQGSFGMVYEGIVRNLRDHLHEIRCAVKTVNEQASVGERIQFLNEASVMKKFSASHVVKLLGVVSRGQPTLVLMELMAKGDLKSYLRSHRPDCAENVSQGRHPPTLRCILKMAIEIADGMAYLADKKFVHRDLAARNCMVAEDLTVKIGDFGMTRDIYETDYYRKGGKGLLPVRWMAPESLRDGIFTTQSDIWSYGVVLWEMATLASQPYQGLSNEQVLKYVMDSGVMERPEGCPDRLYEIMEMCWHYQPRHRPSFLDIIENLLPDVPAQFSDQSFFHSDAGVSAREAQRAHQEQDRRVLHDPRTPLRTAQDGCSLRSRSSSQGSEADEDDRFVPSERLSLHDQALTIEEVDDHVDPSDSLAALEEQLTAESRDHVQVMLAHDRRPYVVVRNPQFVHNNSSNSKSDSSKGTTIPSEDSKGSYVSNGSAGNGYVMGILNHRRHGNAES